MGNSTNSRETYDTEIYNEGAVFWSENYEERSKIYGYLVNKAFDTLRNLLDPDEVYSDSINTYINGEFTNIKNENIQPMVTYHTHRAYIFIAMYNGIIDIKNISTGQDDKIKNTIEDFKNKVLKNREEQLKEQEEAEEIRKLPVFQQLIDHIMSEVNKIPTVHEVPQNPLKTLPARRALDTTGFDTETPTPALVAGGYQ